MGLDEQADSREAPSRETESSRRQGETSCLETQAARRQVEAAGREAGAAGQERSAGAVSGADFRGELYGSYVSGFKGERQASFVWWDHKLLPLLTGVDRSEAVLDIGCGAGGLLAYLGQRGFSRATGIDISAEQVALARRSGVQAVVGDVFEFFARGTATDHIGDTLYGAIFAMDVFEHFSRAELVRLAPLLHAALKPGGRLIVQTANGAGLFPGQVIYGDLTHMTIFTPQSLGQLLHPAGFVDLAFFETGPIPIRLHGKLDVALWQVIKAAASAIRRLETGKRQAIWTENFLCLCRAFKP